MNPQDMQKYQQLYLQTAKQYLQQYLTNLDSLVKNQTQQEVLQQMFIAAHSIKSQSQVMGYERLGNYCKDLEGFLRTITTEQYPLTPEQIGYLQSAEEIIKKELDLIAATGKDITQEDQRKMTNTVSKNKRILLVEDDQFFEKFYAFKLQESGYAVSIAANGEEGLQKLHSDMPNLVLLDLIMPIKDGFEFLKEKATLPEQAIPVIVFSTLGQESDIQRARQLGAIDYVNKSFFDYETLLKKIMTHVK